MSYDKVFHKNYRLLLKFKRKFGTINIPSRPGKKWLKQLNDEQINQIRTVGRWVETLRSQYKKGILQAYKIDMLNHINFEWTPKSKRLNYVKWKKNIDRLKKFKATYGHCNVPEKWSQDIPLADFVVSSRICYKRGKLRAFKIKSLEELGFTWEPGKLPREKDAKGRYMNTQKS